MIEVTGDFWKYKTDWRIIPTNGIVVNHRLVMGAGLALTAKKRYPGIDRELGKLVSSGGNKPYYALTAKDCGLFSFPTKHDWRAPADLELIADSAAIFRSIYDEWRQIFDNSGARRPIVLFPHVGCGPRTGQLQWAQVKPILEPIFPEDNFVAIAHKFA